MVYTYVALAGVENRRKQFYVYRACNRVQLKCSGADMGLKWLRFGSYQAALLYINRAGGQVKKSVDAYKMPGW